MVDDFGFKYTNKRHVDELLKIISQWYVMKMDWGGTSFGGITLKWNYEGEQWVELSLPGYIEKIMAQFRHPQPKRPQDFHIQIRQKKSQGPHQHRHPPTNPPVSTKRE